MYIDMTLCDFVYSVIEVVIVLAPCTYEAHIVITNMNVENTKYTVQYLHKNKHDNTYQNVTLCI